MTTTKGKMTRHLTSQSRRWVGTLTTTTMTNGGVGDPTMSRVTTPANQRCRGGQGGLMRRRVDVMMGHSGGELNPGGESMGRRRVDEEKDRQIEQSRLWLCSFLYFLNYIACI